jgi:hypothetical protein
MDPISLAASVAGILGLAGKLAITISGFVASAQSAPQLATHAVNEINSLVTIFAQLKGLALQNSPARNFITVDQLVVVISGCVITLAELDKELEGLEDRDNMDVWERIKWVNREPTIKALVDRLGVHKSSLNLLLTTLLWYEFCPEI